MAVGAVGGSSDNHSVAAAVAIAIATEVAIDRDDGRLGGQRAGAAVHGQRDDALLLLLLAEASAVRTAVRAGVVAAKPELLVAIVVRVQRRGRHVHPRGQDEAVRGGGHLRGGLLRQAHESAVVRPAPLHPLVADGRRFVAVSGSAPSRLGTIARPWQLVRKVRRCTLPKSYLAAWSLSFVENLLRDSSGVVVCCSPAVVELCACCSVIFFALACV